MAGVALGDTDLHFAWQASTLLWLHGELGGLVPRTLRAVVRYDSTKDAE